MSSISEEKINFDHSVVTAAGWRSKDENPEFGDSMYKTFCQVMELRRRYAIEYLKADLDSEKKSLMAECIKHYNNKIKEVLGI